MTERHARPDPGREPPRIEQRGLYFDELEQGAVYVHAPGRTVTEADNVLFTTLTMNTQSLHLDAAWSSGTEFGEPLVNSMFTLSTLVGLSVAQLTQGTIVANLGFSEVSFPAPVRHGDTLYAETLIAAKRRSTSRATQGIVEFHHTARNQDGTVVAVAKRSTLMRLSPRALAAESEQGSGAEGDGAKGDQSNATGGDQGGGAESTKAARREDPGGTMAEAGPASPGERAAEASGPTSGSAA